MSRGKNLVAGDSVPLDVMVALQVGNGMLGNEDDIIVTDPEYPEETEEMPDVMEEDPFEEVIE